MAASQFQPHPDEDDVAGELAAVVADVIAPETPAPGSALLEEARSRWREIDQAEAGALLALGRETSNPWVAALCAWSVARHGDRDGCLAVLEHLVRTAEADPYFDFDRVLEMCLHRWSYTDPAHWRDILQAVVERMQRQGADDHEVNGTRLDLADVEFRLGNAARGLAVYEPILSADPLDVDTYDCLAGDLLQAGCFALAAAAADRGLAVARRTGDRGPERVFTRLARQARASQAASEAVAGGPADAATPLSVATRDRWHDILSAPLPEAPPPPLPFWVRVVALTPDRRPLPPAAAGRNDPCPCGSGRKYKRCCLPVDETYRRVRPLFLELEEALGAFALADGMESAWAPAWERYWRDQAPRRVEDWHYAVFGAWFAYTGHDGEGHRILQRFAGLPERTASEREIVGAWLPTCASLHQVEAVVPGSGVVLRNLVTGEVSRVADVGLSTGAAPWDLILAHVLPLDGASVLTATVPYTVPASEKQDLLARVEQLRQARGAATTPGEAPAEWLRSIYPDLVHAFTDLALHPAVPRVVTPEGDDAAMCVALYGLTDPAAALGALAASPHFRAVPEADPPEFTWVGPEPLRPIETASGHHEMLILQSRLIGGSEEHPALGRAVVTAEPAMIRLETASEPRLQRGRALLAGLLGTSAVFIDQSVEFLDDVAYDDLDLEDDDDGDEGPDDEGFADDDGGEEDLPQAVLTAVARRYIEEAEARWVDESIPALGGRTPREALESQDGRAALEELLRVMENIEARAPDTSGAGMSVARLRRRLGL